MTHAKFNLAQALQQGQACTYTLSEGGDFASMRAAFKYGQEITISPVGDFHEVQAGDIVYVRWRGGGCILHPVAEVNGDQFLIANSLGKINGWVHGSAILGKVTRIVDPEDRPPAPEMLARLRAAYQELAPRCGAAPAEAARLEAIVSDLGWYMDRLGPERWTRLPRQNKWSFESNLWYLTKNARAAVEAEPLPSIANVIDQGKWVTGLAAETLALFENYDWEYLS